MANDCCVVLKLLLILIDPKWGLWLMAFCDIGWMDVSGKGVMTQLPVLGFE